MQLAGGRAQGEQPLFGLVQPPRFKVEGVGRGIHRSDGLGRLNHGPVDGLDRRAQPQDHRVVALGARLPRPLARMLDGAQSRPQLLAQLVAAQLDARVGEVRQRLFRRP